MYFIEWSDAWGADRHNTPHSALILYPSSHSITDVWLKAKEMEISTALCMDLAVRERTLHST